MSSIRARWAAVGAAVAVCLGAGGIGVSQAVLDSGSKPVFVAITPCRLVDTRPGPNNVGDRTSPLGPGGTLELEVTGATGKCTGIPSDATAAALNVTAIQGSDTSFLTVYPADAALPLASNLNWTAGAAPTPNKVDVDLSPTGAVKMTNAFGTVHVAADLVGYYLDHTHDDRYYTEDEVDAALDQVDAAIEQLHPDLGYVQPHIIDFVPQTPSSWKVSNGWTYSGVVNDCLYAPVEFDVGAELASIDVTYAAAAPVTVDVGILGLRTSAGSTLAPDIATILLYDRGASFAASPTDQQVTISVANDPGDPIGSTPREPAQPGFDYILAVCPESPMTVVSARAVLS